MAPQRSLEDSRQIYPFRQPRRPLTVFNIGGHDLRLIARVEHHRQESMYAERFTAVNHNLDDQRQPSDSKVKTRSCGQYRVL